MRTNIYFCVVWFRDILDKMAKSWTALAAQHRFLKKGVSGGSEPVILESSTKMVCATIPNSIPTNSTRII